METEEDNVSLFRKLQRYTPYLNYLLSTYANDLSKTDALQTLISVKEVIQRGREKLGRDELEGAVQTLQTVLSQERGHPPEKSSPSQTDRDEPNGSPRVLLPQDTPGNPLQPPTTHPEHCQPSPPAKPVTPSLWRYDSRPRSVRADPDNESRRFRAETTEPLDTNSATSPWSSLLTEGRFLPSVPPLNIRPRHPPNYAPSLFRPWGDSLADAPPPSGISHTHSSSGTSFTYVPTLLPEGSVKELCALEGKTMDIGGSAVSCTVTAPPSPGPAGLAPPSSGFLLFRSSSSPRAFHPWRTSAASASSASAGEPSFRGETPAFRTDGPSEKDRRKILPGRQAKTKAQLSLLTAGENFTESEEGVCAEAKVKKSAKTRRNTGGAVTPTPSPVKKTPCQKAKKAGGTPTKEVKPKTRTLTPQKTRKEATDEEAPPKKPRGRKPKQIFVAAVPSRSQSSVRSKEGPSHTDCLLCEYEGADIVQHYVNNHPAAEIPCVKFPEVIANIQGPPPHWATYVRPRSLHWEKGDRALKRPLCPASAPSCWRRWQRWEHALCQPRRGDKPGRVRARRQNGGHREGGEESGVQPVPDGRMQEGDWEWNCRDLDQALPRMTGDEGDNDGQALVSVLEVEEEAKLRL